MNEGRISDFEGSTAGSILRNSRESQGFRLEDVSETTKIAVNYLKALEEDNSSEFLNAAYLKGFLRIYATYLGLDPDNLLRLNEVSCKVYSITPDIQTNSNSKKRHSFIPLQKLMFPGFLLITILLTATFIKRPPPPLVRQPQSVPVVAAPQVAAIQNVQSSAQVNMIEKEAPASPPAQESRTVETSESEVLLAKRLAETSKGFILKLKVTQNGTMTAVVDGAIPQQYELTAGDIIEWKAENRVALELSNAGGVELEINGKPCKSVGFSGKPVYVEFDANGVIL